MLSNICVIYTYTQVECLSSNPCKGKLINATLASSLTVNCYSQYDCRERKVLCPDTDGATCTVNCFGQYSCYYAFIEAVSDNIIHNFTLNCNRKYSCYHMEIALNSSSVNNVDVKCDALLTSTYTYTCGWMSITSSAIINSFNFDCLREYGCYYISIVLQNVTHSNINCLQNSACYQGNIALGLHSGDAHISCDNNEFFSGQQYETKGACYSMNLYISSADALSALTLNCENRYDCIELYMDSATQINLQSLNINCNEYYGCGLFRKSSTFILNGHIETATIMCTGSRSCIYPIWKMNATSLIINCTGSLSCYNAHDEFDVRFSKHLVLNCLSAEACGLSDFYFTGNGPNSNITINCEDSGTHMNSGACRFLDVTVTGYEDNSTNAVINCKNVWDCRGNTYNGYDLQSLTVNCMHDS